MSAVLWLAVGVAVGLLVGWLCNCMKRRNPKHTRRFAVPVEPTGENKYTGGPGSIAGCPVLPLLHPANAREDKKL